MTQEDPKKYTVKCNEVGCEEYYYSRGKCRRHYKQLLGREGGYIKDYQRRKNNPAYKEMKKKSDRAYRSKLIDSGILSKKQKIYYSNYISKSENRDIRNIREKIRYNNRSSDQKFKDNATQRVHNDVIKYEVMNHYSDGKLCCANCGIDVYPLLTIDHINNDGAKHRKEISNGKSLSSATYRWLRSHGYPGGFQVLCQNCNYFKDLIIRIERPTRR